MMQEYFEEAKRWYYMKYLQSLRFIIFIAVVTLLTIFLSFFALYATYETKTHQERVSKVIFTEYDVSLFPVMQKIGKHYHSNDINILLYTVRTFIENFESYPKTSNQYTAFVQKNQSMQKYTSPNVLKTLESRFNNQYSKKLENNGFVKVVIQNIDFLRNEKSLLQKMHDFLMPELIPTKARVFFTLYVFDGQKLTKKDQLIEVKFAFQEIKKQKDGTYSNIRFFVQEYTYI